MKRLTLKQIDAVSDRLGVPRDVIRFAQERERNSSFENARLFLLTYVNGAEELVLLNQVPDLNPCIRALGEDTPAPSFFSAKAPFHVTFRSDLVLSCREMSVKEAVAYGVAEEVPRS